MLKACILFVLGMLLLIKGGDWFVDGATSLAYRFHIPEMIVGATVVSIGTTIPEVMVSATSAVMGHGSIAYGNAIGSVICNTAVVAAVTMTFRPGPVRGGRIGKIFACFLIAAAFYCVVSYTFGTFYRWTGIVLLGIFLLFLIDNIRDARMAPPEAKELAKELAEAGQTEQPLWKTLLMLVVGAALIAVGADLLVDNGTIIAESLGVPESVIALTFVALGTSLPELVTAITSAVKGHSDLSVGNVIGANLFNLVLVSGVAITLSPFDIPVAKQVMGMNASLVIDIPVMLLVMLVMCLPILLTKKLYRWQGIMLLCIYVAFCGVQFFL